MTLSTAEFYAACAALACAAISIVGLIIGASAANDPDPLSAAQKTSGQLGCYFVGFVLLSLAITVMVLL